MVRFLQAARVAQSTSPRKASKLQRSSTPHLPCRRVWVSTSCALHACSRSHGVCPEDEGCTDYPTGRSFVFRISSFPFTLEVSFEHPFIECVHSPTTIYESSPGPFAAEVFRWPWQYDVACWCFRRVADHQVFVWFIPTSVVEYC